MKEIVLVIPPVNFEVKSDYQLDHPVMGPLMLGAMAERKGYSVAFFDNRDRFWTLNQLIKKIEKEKPRIVGISAFTSNIRGAVQLAQALKKKDKKRPAIILGGPHLSADPEIIKRFPFFDVGVTGEAEITFIELVEKIIKGRKKVSGLFQGKIPEDLDSLPFPSRSLVDWSRYPLFRTHDIMTSRGCPFRCNFCSVPSIERKKIRFRSPKNVVEEMKLATTYIKTNNFTFIDDTLTLNRDFIIALCDELIDQELDFHWEGQTRANLVDEQLLKKMKAAGCQELCFGVESGDERIRNEVIGKKIKDKEIKKAIRLCQKQAILADYYLMLGFPEEGHEEVEKTVNFAFKYPWQPNVIGIHLTLPLPGAPIFEQAIKEGVLPQNVIDRYIRGEYGFHFNESWPYYTNQEVPLEYLKEARARAYRRFYFRPSYLWHRLKTDWRTGWRLKQDFQKAKELLSLGRARHLE